MIIDFCAQGEILGWDEDSSKFSPYHKSNEPFEESQIRQFMRDLVEGLDHLHKSGICHRDIKPMNILVDQNNVCMLADFGSSDFFIDEGNDTFSDSVGTYEFFSPEMCDSNVTIYSGTKADIWALGIVLFAMTFNVLPFDTAEGENENDLFNKILESGLDFDSRDRVISDGLRDLITAMLDKNPETRISIDQMKHFPWLNEGYAASLADRGCDLLANLSD